MEKIDFTGLSPDITAYIMRLETQVKEQTTKLEEQSKTVETQRIRIDQLMHMVANFQKALYGQSSEKSKYVLGEKTSSFPCSMKRRPSPIVMLPNPTTKSLLLGI